MTNEQITKAKKIIADTRGKPDLEEVFIAGALDPKTGSLSALELVLGSFGGTIAVPEANVAAIAAQNAAAAPPDQREMARLQLYRAMDVQGCAGNASAVHLFGPFAATSLRSAHA